MPASARDRLIFDFEVSDTSPVVKGTWVTVSHIVSLIVDGWSWADILGSHPELVEADIRAAVAYAMSEDEYGSHEEAGRGPAVERDEEGGPGAVLDVPRGGRDAPSEDRGTRAYVYGGSSGTWSTFGWSPEATHLTVISVPIGWALAPEENNGVVLRSTFGRTIAAETALAFAGTGRFGFRRVSQRGL